MRAANQNWPCTTSSLALDLLYSVRLRISDKTKGAIQRIDERYTNEMLSVTLAAQSTEVTGYVEQQNLTTAKLNGLYAKTKSRGVLNLSRSGLWLDLVISGSLSSFDMGANHARKTISNQIPRVLADVSYVHLIDSSFFMSNARV